MAAMILLPIITFLLIALLAAWQRWYEAASERDMYKRWWEESSRKQADLDSAMRCICQIRSALDYFDGGEEEVKP